MATVRHTHSLYDVRTEARSEIHETPRTDQHQVLGVVLQLDAGRVQQLYPSLCE